MSDPRDDEPPGRTHLYAPRGTGEQAGDPELREAEDQTRKLAARYANRLYAAPDGHNVRLVFGERVRDETVFHTSLIVSAGDGLLMARLISEIAGATVDWQIENAGDHLEALKDLRSADPAEGPSP